MSEEESVDSFLERFAASFKEQAGEAASDGVRELLSPDLTHARYAFDIQRADFMVELEKEALLPHVRVTYPSTFFGKLTFEVIHQSITDLFTAAYPRQDLTPKATFKLAGKEVTFDLQNAWKLHTLEKNISDVEQIFFFSEGTAGSFVPEFFKSASNRGPHFLCALWKAEGDWQELIQMSHLAAASMDVEFAGEVLSRHSRYRPKEEDKSTHAQDFVEKIHNLAKKHPPLRFEPY